MKDNLSRYTFRTKAANLKKLEYVAEYYGCTKNKEIEQLELKHIAEFEKEHGVIVIAD